MTEADETKKQKRMTCVDSELQVCTWVQSLEADFSAITRNKTPLNLLSTKIF